MLSPEYLAGFPDYIVELFEQYDAFVIADFSRRVAKAASITETAQWQAVRAEEMGLAMDELTARSAELLGITQSELKTMFQEACDTYVATDKARLSGSGLDYDRIAGSKALQRYMKAARKQTQRSLRNIVGTAGAIKSMTGTKAIQLKTGTGYQPVRKAYTMALDLAQMQVSSGILDYETAVRHAIRTTARSGVSTLISDAVGYASGYHLSLRSAARMCVLTGVNQMAGQMNELVCDELGLDLVEVTAHLGARPSHQVWQGKIYSRSGKSKKYPDLISSTGLGDVAGLMGANCRHSYYGYYEGSPRAYTDAELYAMTDEGGPKTEYGGKTYTYYEAAQKQRQLERQIIATKRELIGYQAAEDKEAFQSASIRLRAQKTRYQDFSKAAGIRSKWERSQQDGYDRSIAGKSAWAVRKSTVVKSSGSSIIQSGARITDPENERGQAFAKNFYAEVRSRTTDSARIAANVGKSKAEIQKVKDYLFVNKSLYDEDLQVWRRFDEDCMIAQSWQRLTDGKNIMPHDRTLIEHELYEIQLKAENPTMSHEEAHARAQSKYNYTKEAREFYDNLSKSG